MARASGRAVGASRGRSGLLGCRSARRRTRASGGGRSCDRLEAEELTEVGAESEEVLAARVVAVQRGGEVVDGPATAAAAEAVPAARRGFVDVQAWGAVSVEG